MFRSIGSFICIMLVLVSFGCSTNSFLPVHEYGVLGKDGTTLGQRTVSDPHAFSPGTQRSWMEVCQRKVADTFFGTDITYKQPCEVTQLTGLNFVTFSPYVNGLATPLIQAGAIVGASALLADGIRDSASRTTNSTTNTNTNTAKGGAGTENSGPVLKNSFNNNSIGNTTTTTGDKNHIQIK